MATSAPLPREIYVWIHSLDLTYKVENPRQQAYIIVRDFSNGYIIAEILARYFPGQIEMYSFDNVFKIGAKLHNWEFLERYFRKFGIEITFADYDPVAHRAPGAAVSLIKKLYTHFTSKEIIDPVKPASLIKEPPLPDYMKPTIANRMKDRELTRIVDNKKQAQRATEIIQSHNETLRVERQNPARYTKRSTALLGKKFASETQSIKSPISIAKTPMKEPIEEEEVKEVSVKVAGKKLKGGGKGLFAGEEDATSSTVYLIGEVIQRTVLEKLSKSDPEYKQYKQDVEAVSAHFLNSASNLPDQILALIFVKLENKTGDIAKVIQNNSTQLLDFFKFCGKLFQDLHPQASFQPAAQGEYTSTSQHTANTTSHTQAPIGRPHFSSLADTLAQVVNKVLNHDPTQCELIFLEHVLPEMLQVLLSSPIKLNSLSFLFYCFISTNSNSHLRLLKKLKREMIGEFGSYMQILALLVQLEKEETMSMHLYHFYLEQVKRALLCKETITRVKGLSVLSYLSRVAIHPVIALLDQFALLVHDHHWEIKGQILILCSNILMKLNEIQTQPEATGTQNLTGATGQQEKKEPSKEQHIEPQMFTGGVVEEEPSNISNMSPSKEKTGTINPSDRDAVLAQAPIVPREQIDEQQSPVFSFLVASPTPLPPQPINAEDVIPKVFELIAIAFNEYTPKLTLKLGLIYLAKVLHIYPAFAEKYLDILLKIPDQMRQSVLDVHPLSGSEEEVYVSGCYTQKYRTYGAPLEWNSLAIAQQLERRIKEENLKTLELAHLDIFEGALEQDFYEQELLSWLDIFASLKSYFFIALCDRDDSPSALVILKKFFCHSKLTERVVEVSREIIVRTTKLMSQPDVEQECRDNFRDFLEFIHDFQFREEGAGKQIEESSSAVPTDKGMLKEFVYQVVKDFATQMPAAYERSNLIELMNRVVAERRGQIFQ